MRRRPLLALAAVPVLAHARPLAAPNVIAVGPRLVTSGQPPADQLGRLRELGFEAVVCLVPADIPAWVAGEDRLVREQGLAWAHVPVPFVAPTEAHAQACSDALARFASRRTLVHCELNFRASTMTFLHRVLALGEPADEAYDAVAQVWSPVPAWRQLVVRRLKAAGITFEPY